MDDWRIGESDGALREQSLDARRFGHDSERQLRPVRVAVPSAILATRSRARSRRMRSIVVCEGLARALSFAFAVDAGAGRSAGAALIVAALVLTVLGGTAVAGAYGLYSRDDDRPDRSIVEDVPRIAHVSLVITWVVAVEFWIGQGTVQIGAMLVLLGSLVLLTFFARLSIRAVHRHRGDYIQNTVIVGAGSVGQLIADKLVRGRVCGLRPVGFVDDDPPGLAVACAQIPLLGSVRDLPDLVRRHDVQRVIVAFSSQSHERTVGLLRSLHGSGVQVDVVPRLFDAFSPTAEIHAIDGLPLIGHPPASQSKVALSVKRAFDLVAAATALVVLSPVLVVIALLVRLNSSGPAVYRAQRVGRGGRLFTQFKFRTMKLAYCGGPAYGGEEADTAFQRLLAEDPSLSEQYARTHKLDPDPRVTRIGRMLRATSLDELPQLLNVVRGDLSLVGPRPVTTLELPRYGEDVVRLLSVRPGLTGYWQVSGRSALGYDERIRLDLAYVTSWSLKLDLRILVRTFQLLVRRGGAV